MSGFLGKLKEKKGEWDQKQEENKVADIQRQIDKIFSEFKSDFAKQLGKLGLSLGYSRLMGVNAKAREGGSIVKVQRRRGAPCDPRGDPECIRRHVEGDREQDLLAYGVLGHHRQGLGSLHAHLQGGEPGLHEGNLEGLPPLPLDALQREGTPQLTGVEETPPKRPER